MTSKRLGNKRNLYYPRGAAHHSTKLTEAQVREARRLKEKLGLCAGCIRTLIGGEKVSPSTFWEMLNYETWKHVK